MSDPPDGYKRAKAAKHDEYNPRPARPVGRPRVCQCCYRSSGDIFDHVCKQCLKDRYDVALLEREIAKAFPSTERMTTAEIFRRLWEQNQKLSKQVAALKKAKKYASSKT